MKLSSKARYATEAMVDLARHSDGGLVLLRDVSERIVVSEGYLEQLLMPLKAGGLVRTARGANGGFALGRHRSEIRLSDILRVVEGSMAPAQCVDEPQACARSAMCPTREVWARMKEATDHVLESTTLQDLIELKHERIEKEAANATNR